MERTTTAKTELVTLLQQCENLREISDLLVTGQLSSCVADELADWLRRLFAAEDSRRDGRDYNYPGLGEIESWPSMGLTTGLLMAMTALHTVYRTTAHPGQAAFLFRLCATLLAAIGGRLQQLESTEATS